MRKLVHVNVEMLERISYGHREHMMAMLEIAEQEVRQWIHGMKEIKLRRVDDLIFSEVHKMKTTFSMLQAGEVVLLCQGILDQKDCEVDERLKQIWKALIRESKIVLEDIQSLRIEDPD